MTVNYALRPAKNIERKMMGEALARLAVVRPLSQYRYVGFGSEFFNDFALYHQLLGIRDMVSIERDDARVARCRFNRPFKCIKIVSGASKSVLPQLSWNKRTIVWLDYTSPLELNMLEDVSFVLATAVSGSVLILTVNADADGGDTETQAADLPAKRLERLTGRVGKVRIPTGVTGASLAKWGLAEVSYRVISGEIQATMNNRNAPLGDQRMLFKQCFHFQYRDTQRMLTVGGVLAGPKDASRLGNAPFKGLSFVREGADAMLLEPPTLTAREVRHMNRRLPHGASTPRDLPWLSSEERERYREVYRYFPVYAESEL